MTSKIKKDWHEAQGKTALHIAAQTLKTLRSARQRFPIQQTIITATTSHCKPAAGRGNAPGGFFAGGALALRFLESARLEGRLQDARRRYFALSKQYPQIAPAL